MARIGVMLKREVPPSDLIAHARRHRHGFDELWVVEDLPYAGGISQAAAVLASTADVVVGHGIAPAPFRNPAALAMEWATLAEMFPGRFVAGIGHGVQSWMDDVGARARSPLTLLEETHAAVTGLLAGQHVDVDGEYVRLRDVALAHPPTHAPRVSLGVTGPRSLALAGAVAAGTILAEGHGPAQIAGAREHLAAGAARAGRSIADHDLTVFAAIHVGDPAAMAPRNPEAPTTWEAIGDDPDVVARQLATLVDAGADSIVLNCLGADLDDQLRLVATEVLPALRA